jgi:hypothetical protein
MERKHHHEFKLSTDTDTYRIIYSLFLFTGSGEDLSWLLKQWKTINMDVDARGRPCKERMLQILLRYKNLQKILKCCG